MSQQINCVFAAHLSGLQPFMNNEKCISRMTLVSPFLLLLLLLSSPHSTSCRPRSWVHLSLPQEEGGEAGGYGPTQIVWHLIPGCSDALMPEQHEINHSLIKLML